MTRQEGPVFSTSSIAPPPSSTTTTTNKPSPSSWEVPPRIPQDKPASTPSTSSSKAWQPPTSPLRPPPPSHYHKVTTQEVDTSLPLPLPSPLPSSPTTTMSTWMQLMLVVVAGLGFMADALEVSLISFLGTSLQNEWGISRGRIATLGVAVFAGEILGCVFWGPAADYYGRKRTYLVSCVVMSVASLLSAVAPDFDTLVVARTVVGFGIGGLCVPYDLLCEATPPKHRGRLLMMMQGFWTLGSLAVVGLAWLLLQPTIEYPGGRWRVMLGVAAVPVIIATLSGFLLPESPRWVSEHTSSNHPSPPTKKRSRLSSALWTLRALVSPRLRKTSLLIWGIWFCFGIGYYGLVMLTPVALGSSHYGSILWSSSAEVLGLVLGLSLIDHPWGGRRRTQAVTYLVGGIGCLLMVVNLRPSTMVLAWSMVARMGAMASSSASWVATPELYPTAVRSTGHCLASAVARCGAMLAPVLTMGAAKASPKWALMGLAGVNFLAAGLSRCLPAETAGEDLMSVDKTTALEEEEDEEVGASSSSQVEMMMVGGEEVDDDDEEEKKE